MVSTSVVAGVLIFKLIYQPPSLHHKVRQLEVEVKNLDRAIQLERDRQFKMQKIVAIINRFNSEMALAQKQEIAKTIYEMTQKYSNLDIDLICATITLETGRTWNPEAHSRAGAMGLMQIMPATGKAVAQEEALAWISDEAVLFNPIYNIRLGCRYLSSLLDSFDDTASALAAYNGGVRGAASWKDRQQSPEVLWNETRNYVPSVLKLMDEYRQMDL
jgi:soluble lytic murein transglycosylase